MGGRAGDGTVLIRAFVPERLGAIAHAEEAVLLDAVVRHVGEVLGAAREPGLTRVTRWPAMMPKYAVGHPRIVRPRRRPAWRTRSAWRAGLALRGVGVPDCVADGRRQAAPALEAVVLGRAVPGSS